MLINQNNSGPLVNQFCHEVTSYDVSFLSPPPLIIFTPTHLKRQMTLFGDKLYLQVAIYKGMNLSTAFSTVKDYNK